MTPPNPPVYVELSSGQIIDLTEAVYRNLSAEDIFYGLSRILRFNGRSCQCDGTISVLQHSYAMYEFARDVYGLNDEVCVKVLMHDAHEALVGDIIAPISGVSSAFSRFLTSVQDRVFERFGITCWGDDEVKAIDRHALAVEWGEFVAVDDAARRVNGYLFGWSQDLQAESRYDAYLQILNKVRGYTVDDLVQRCCLTLYRHIALMTINNEG